MSSSYQAKGSLKDESCPKDLYLRSVDADIHTQYNTRRQHTENSKRVHTKRYWYGKKYMP